MRSFEIEKKRLLIDGKEQYLMCGEIHYFRMEPENWGKALDKLKEAGCNAVAFYVPWFVHEIEEGSFDFDGSTNPKFNLVKWMDLIKEKDLLAFVRPGPYIYAESTNMGIPQWYFDNYPDATVKEYKDGKLTNKGFEAAAPHNHPKFLECVEKWYAKVCSVVKDYQMPQGNVFMIQACNEIPGMDIDDQNPDTLGLGKENGLFPTYLKNKYDSIDNLNKAYKLNFNSFLGVKPSDLMVDKTKYETEHLEFYYTYYYPEYFKKLIKIFKDNGITVPVTHNAYNPRAISLHYHTKKQIPELFIGVDCYYSMQGQLDAKSLAYYCEFGAELLKTMVNCPPVVLEQECGYWHDYPIVYGPQLYDWIIWTFAAGYKGMNMYLFAEGINEPRMGYFGTSHNWQAPVTLNGEEGENYPWIKKAIKEINENEAVFNADRVNDIALGIYNEPGLIWRPVSRSSSETNFMMFMNSVSSEVVDIEGASLEELKNKKLVWVVSNEYMPKDLQNKLIRYAKEGGNLVIQGTFPYKNLEEENVCLLGDAIEASVLPKDLEANVYQEKIILNGEEIYVGKPIQPVKLDGKVIAKDRNGSAVITRKEIEKGSITVIPFDMEYMFKSQCKIIDEVLKGNEINPVVKANKSRSILKAGKQGQEYLISLNYHPVAIEEVILIRDKEYKINLQPYEYKIIEIK